MLQILGDHRGGEARQGGEGIGGVGWMHLLQAALEIGGAKELPARRFGGAALDVGLLQPAADQGLIGLALGRPGPARIKALGALAEVPHRQVQQRVGGATIPAEHRRAPLRPRAGRQQGQVGDAPQVQQGPPAANGGKQGGVRGWHEGRPLAAQGEIGGTEIKDYGRVQPVGQALRMQQLPAVAGSLRAGGTVPECLAVAAHPLSAPLRIAGQGRLGLHVSESFAELQQVPRGGGLSLADRHDLIAQGGWVGHRGSAVDLPAGPPERSVEAGEHRINAIGAGAAHQSQDPHRPAKSPREFSRGLAPLTRG